METRANFVLIGIFTLVGLIGSLGFLLWFAKIEVDRQYNYFDILFDDVAGLATAGDVRYNGLPVGQVVNLAIDEADPSKVRIRIEVRAETPVNTETRAQLQSQGVTGVSYVALSGGSETATPLPDGSEIRSERSALQSVFEGAPILLDRAVELLENINRAVSEENLAAVDTILRNLASASGRLDSAMGEIEQVTSDLSSVARDVSGFTSRLDALADTADTTLTAATRTFETADQTIAEISRIAQDDVPGLIADIRQATQSATRVIDAAGTDIASVSTQLQEIAAIGKTTLQTATGTFETANTTLMSVTDAMGNASTTLETVNETFAMANTLLETDFSQISEDISRAANALTISVTDASRNIDEISKEVLSASQSAASFVGRLDTLVTQNQRQVSDFLRIGLPEFLRFTEEARLLVANLGRLTNRVERDPARFLLGTQNSEFRR
jgi:phospholipid/cholesterol/gamma-HCH transport system substrate-binding protein